MEFFRNPNLNWLGWKWYFLAFSMIFSVAGITKMAWNWSHIGSPVPLGVDFRGGTQVDVQFTNPPDITAIRRAIDTAGLKDASIQTFGPAADHQVLISLPEETNETALDTGRQEIESALQAHYNNYFNPNTGVKVDVVGPTVGHQLEKQATLATLYSMAGMLVYLWFRFQLIYGVAAVVACFHDTLITVGAFALTGREISLTVIAAILTLVGYSMNDTIVVFDRIRENLRLSRREASDRPGEPQHQPDLEPDGAHFGPHFPHCAFVVYLRWPGAQRILLCPGGGNSDRNLFIHCHRRPHAGGLAGMARGQRQTPFASGRKTVERLRIHGRLARLYGLTHSATSACCRSAAKVLGPAGTGTLGT